MGKQLLETENWFREKCRECADIKFRPINLGKYGEIKSLAIYLEVTAENLMLGESMLGRMIMQLQEMDEEAVLQCIEKNELGISDVFPLDTKEDGMRALLAGNMILLIDGLEKILKIPSVFL